MNVDEFIDQYVSIKKWEKLLDEHEKNGFQQKNSFLSHQVRNEGNELFTQKSHDQKSHQMILQLYTKSIALADEKSEEQAMGYGNRSAFLFHLHKHKECVIDIDRACNITQSAELKNRLILRKEKCLALIKEEEEDKLQNLSSSQKSAVFPSEFMKDILNICSNDVLMDIFPKKVTSFKDSTPANFNKIKLNEVESPSKMIPSFSDSLSLKYNKEFGRHVVAAKDIKPGEVLAIESGFVCPAINNLKMYLACSYCLNFTWTGIPCPSCVFAIYCSETCKMKAWKEYHDIECSILPPLLCEAFLNEHSSQEMLCTRLFINFVKNEGLQNIINQAQCIETNKDSQIDGLLIDGKFDKTKFKSFYNLQSDDGDDECDAEYASITALVLARYTPMLKNLKEVEYMEKIVQIKKLLIKIKAISGNNGDSFTDLECGCTVPQECSFHCPKILGYIVAPSLGLFNHSCVKNVDRLFCEDGRIMLFAIQPIKKNEQLFINYGVGLATPKEERQITLKKMKNFICNCEACKNNWTHNPFWRPKDFTVFSRIKEDLKRYQKLLSKKKNVDYVSLAHTIKLIELAYKYLNKYDAYMYSHNVKLCMSKLMYKLYGVEMKIPDKC